MNTFTELLTLEPDCYGIGDGCLVDTFALLEFEKDAVNYVNGGDPLPLYNPLHEEKVEKWLAKYVGTPVTVVDHNKVFAQDGTYLGIYYI